MFGRRSKELSQQLRDVAQQMEKLTGIIDNLQKTVGHSARINIEQLQIDQAFLDKLVFRLENLDIDELSGSLNLGNNFSPKVNQGSSVAEEDSPKPGFSQSEERRDDNNRGNRSTAPVALENGSRLETTDTGYLISL